jgi:hypothetical protein
MNMIISPTDLVFGGIFFYRNLGDRCYQLVEPSGAHSRAARMNLFVSKRVSLAYYNECHAACLQKLQGKKKAPRHEN